ncbi:MAG: peptidylprolyl isomerase [Bacteroidetes bacterium]|nr:peptidylprolyl isomerase [Bacteroidota bacterium]
MSRENVTQTKEEAEAFADSLLNVINASPDKIEILAINFSDDPSAAENSGNLDWFADGSMLYPFNNAVLKGQVGDITMVETMFGYHVIKITGKQKPVKKVRVAIIDIDISPSQQTYQDVFTKTSEFQGKSTSLEAFDTLATNMGLNKRSATYLQPMGDRIAGLDYPRPIIQWSFIEGIEVGSVSHVFTMEEKYVVAVVTKVREEGIPKLDEIKDMIEPLIITELKGDLMIEKMNNIANETNDLIQIAQKLDSKVDTVDNVNFNMRNIAGYGNEPDLLAKIFTIKTGEMSKTVKGNNAAFFVIVDEIIDPEPNQDRKMYERQMLMNFRAKVNNNSFLQALEEKADIIDNRVMFY